MVCLPEEGIVTKIRDTIGTSSMKQSVIRLTSTKTVESIFTEVGNDFSYAPDGIELLLKNGEGNLVIVLNEYRDKTLEEIGVGCTLDVLNTIEIVKLKQKNMSLCVQENNEDDLLLGASASPTTGEMSNTEPPPLLMSDEEYGLSLQAVLIDSVNYVGLVNQAMTCYLNSLLQALYMTPEFRNALYNWEFDGQNESRSIPFQLQKLFLNLQTSKKKAVETTDLTTSFGWQGSDAWQQHDIQELCRVMFDALEQKFKDTKQANLINDLYEGKMLDYVKCLECGTEKSREDTFLDIPLPVRPFGSNVAYNSVEEALRAFVQPETLDGNNQYHCEKCNKKCDAHKGLKFTNFPYLLTLHLKRFDFDYSTLHRIKLNDKVVFSEALNLNSFIQNNRLDGDQMEEREHIVRCDDCSTTDSGSALDDEGCQTSDLTSNLPTQDVNCEDSDEGIDVSSGNNHETEAKGPYVYDLFSIMIHSGSATGGHYYAYIKDFEKQQWFCFNDQSVSRITEDDIRKTYGGGPQRSYYSGAYSSSTNAYMLMYRQIDAERNCKAITVDEFPTHIKHLLLHMQRKEEQDRLIREKENELIKISVFCYHPIDNKLIDANVSVFIDTTLAEAAAYAYTNPKFKLDGVVAKEDCRIVKYNKHQQCIDSSFDTDTIKFCDIASQVRIIHSDYWMLEIRSPGTEWPTYKPGGISLKVFPISFELEELDETTSVRININETVGDLSNRLAPLLNMEKSSLKIVMENYNNELKYFDNDEEIVRFDPKSLEYRLYVSNTLDEDQDKSFENSRLKKIIHKFRHVFSFVVILPDTNIATLETLSIPSLDLNQNLDKLELAAGDRISPNLRASPQPGPGGICCDGFGDQSNSEDSSLSDSDRTLVGDAPGEGMGLSSNSSNSPADQHMASPTDPTEDAYNYEVLGNPSEEMHWDDEETQEIPRFDTNYFKVTSILSWEGNDPLTDTTYSKYCRVLADKRMTLERLKKHMEPYIKVPVEYFKIFKKYPSSEEELSTDSFGLLRDDAQLVIKLGRVLRKDEYSCKIHLLKPESSDPFYLLFEHVVAKGQTVGRILKEVIIQAKKQHMLDLTYSKCRLREKNWKKPRKVYLENQIFGEDIVLTRNFEMFLQKLSDNERVTSTSQMVVFVRHWRPSTLTLDKMQEVVLTTRLLEELKSCVSEMANIPLENLEIASAKTSIPADVHVLEIQSELDWKPCVTNIEEWPLQATDGSVFFYRDDREQLKELTTEERKEINFQENKRLGKLNSIKTYSPGKERALKIYLDTSPCKTDDNCTD